MSKNKKLILSAMLLALLIVLSRFVSIQTQILVVSLSFIPIMMSAIWLGPKYSAIIAALGDLIGALLFPFGAYFPGYTLSQFISGAIYGLLLYNNNKEMSNKELIVRLIISSILSLGIVSIGITSFWIHIQIQKAYLVVITSRVITQLIMLPIQVMTIFVLEKATRKFVNEYLIDREITNI